MKTEDGEMEDRLRDEGGEENETLLYLPSLKSLNYYWLLFFYFNINIVHLLWTNNTYEHLGLACAHSAFTGIPSYCGKVRSDSIRSGLVQSGSVYRLVRSHTPA